MLYPIPLPDADVYFLYSTQRIAVIELNNRQNLAGGKELWLPFLLPVNVCKRMTATLNGRNPFHSCRSPQTCWAIFWWRRKQNWCTCWKRNPVDIGTSLPLFFFCEFFRYFKNMINKTIYFLPVSFVFVFNPLSLVLSNLAKCAARQESDFPAFFCYIWARIIDRFLRISNFLILLCKPQITWTATQTFWLILFLFFLCPKLNFFHVADANKTIGTIKNVVLKRLSAVKEFLTTVIDNEWLFIYLKKKYKVKKRRVQIAKEWKSIHTWFSSQRLTSTTNSVF